MRVLLDTHTFLWWVADAPPLSRAAREAIRDPANDIFVSAASAWEIATKFRIGKLPSAARLASDLPGVIAREGFTELAVTVLHGQRAGQLPIPHPDPFDRMLIAQAVAEDLLLATNEDFAQFGVRCLW